MAWIPNRFPSKIHTYSIVPENQAKNNFLLTKTAVNSLRNSAQFVKIYRPIPKKNVQLWGKIPHKLNVINNNIN